MKITSIEQAVKLEELIGHENVEASRKLLADGGQLWIFQSKEELENDHELTQQEKSECQKRFSETEGKWAGWFRPPPAKYIPGCSVDPRYDSHGNLRGGSGSSSSWSH